MSTTFLTIQETAQMFRVSARTVRRWIKRGDLPAIKIGKTVRILETDIALLKSTCTPQGESTLNIIPAASDEVFTRTWDNSEDDIYDSYRDEIVRRIDVLREQLFAIYSTMHDSIV